MKKNIIETLDTSFLVMVTNKKQIIKKYSLKERDYKGERFADKDIDLFGLDELLSITKPDVISEIDERFLKSGTDIIVTNTIHANRYYLEKYGLEDNTYELNLTAAKIARNKVSKYSSITRNKPRYVAGCVRDLPTDLEYEYVKTVYVEQLKALLSGKVDLILLHKMSNEQSLKAALSALNKIMTNRKKTIEVIISIDNEELNDWLIDKTKTSDFKNVNIICVGKKNFDEQEYEKLKAESPYKLFAFFDRDKNYDEKKILEVTEKIFEKKLFNIIGYDSMIQPILVEKVMQNIIKS